jgi:energy-coupling factor transporter ATP-binding protein EcfA2
MPDSIQATIVEFAHHRPAWQQDLFRRVFTQTTITSEDLKDVLNLLKEVNGIQGDCSIACRPLSADDTPCREEAGYGAVLSAISDTQHVNRLMGGQELPFAASGITLIYGDNGSGKSGYFRILKQLCRVRRERPERVLGDVYGSAPPPPAQAKLLYSIGGEPQEHQWVDGTPAPKELSHISVFDAQAAPIYIDRQNQVEFLPAGLDVLPRVGAALQNIAELLDGEIAPLAAVVQQPIVQIKAGTAAAALVNRFSSAVPPSENEVKQAAVWGSQDDDALASIRARLIQLAEPAKAAGRCRRIKAALDRVRMGISRAGNGLTDTLFNEFERLRAQAVEAQHLAQTSASVEFKGDPFGTHVDSAAWRNLFRYAREFSETVYPKEAFPVIGEDKRCVLCQQVLSSEASGRLRRFHDFVERSASQNARKLEQEVGRRLSEMRAIQVPSAEAIKADLAEYSATGADAEALVQSTEEYAAALLARQQVFASGSAFDVRELVPSLPSFDVTRLLQVAEALEHEAAHYDKSSADTSVRAGLERERDEIEARRALNSELPRVLGRLSVIEHLAKLRKCKSACDTAAISRKASALREEHLTELFHARLTTELGRLGIDYLPLKIAGKTERGASFVGVVLDQTASARVASVLSEGEFRVLALACFLAEIQGIPGHDGIVIDDPVSSLDHLHIRQVARRLVAEARTRSQVVIFTHNLPFYYELLEAAGENEVPVEAHWLERTSTRDCGYVRKHDAPWQVKKVRERLANLEQILAGIPKPCDCSQQDYVNHVKSFYAPLRETWERLVEERLLNGVVGRFEPGVKTQSLKGVSVEDPDYQKVFVAMTKASRYSGHDGAVSFQTSLPNPVEMREDLAFIRKYESELKKRASQIGPRREALEEPIVTQSA